MRVLVACEFSGVVRRAFRAAGHDAWSCDLLPAEDESPFHIQCSALHLLSGLPWPYSNPSPWPLAWDLMIAHPPCTYLTNAGARWWQAEALELVRLLLAAPIARIALENPPGRIGSQIRKADQYVHPWQFGHMETKTTGLWLKGLPQLKPTNIVHAEMQKLPAHQKHRVHYMSPSADRAKDRSRTYQGIADAMAQQWGALDPCRPASDSSENEMPKSTEQPSADHVPKHSNRIESTP